MQYEILSMHGTSYFDSKIILTFYIEYLKFKNEAYSFFDQQSLCHALQLKNNTLSDLLADSVQSYLLGGIAFPYEVFRTITITYNNDFVFSGYLDDYIFSGGAHGNTIRHSFTYLVNCDSMTNLYLNDFQIIQNTKEEIINEMIMQIQNSNNEEKYFDNYKELLFKYYNENNFYIDENGVVIYFQLYEIAPYVTGIPTFHISFSI